MGFLENVVLSNGSPPKQGGGFLDSVTMKTPQELKIDSAAKAAEDARRAANETSGVSGMFKTAAKDLWGTAKAAVPAAIDYAKAGFQQSANLGESFRAHPIDTLAKSFNAVPQHVSDAFATSFNASTEDVTRMLEDYQNGTGSTAGNVANLARLTSHVAGMIFSPTSGTFSAAEDFPVLKQAADAFNVPFTLTGLAGAYASGKVVDVLPIDQASKDILREPISELGNLAAQVFIGGRLMAKAADIYSSGRQVTPAEARRVVAEVRIEHPEVFNPPPDAPNVPSFMTPAQRHAEYAKSQGYEPYVSPENLPTIDAGKGRVPSNGLPSINASAPRAARVPGDIRYEPLPGEKLAPQEPARRSAPSTKKEAPPADTPGDLKAPEDGAKSESGLAASVKQDAIQSGLEDSFGRLPEYGRVNMAEQAQLARDLIAKDEKLAMRVAKGEVASPIPHLLPESVFTALRVAARETGNIELFRQLAEHSNTTEAARVMGQRIKALDSGMNKNDPLAIMQDIKESRSAGVERKAKGQIEKERTIIAEDIRKEIKKNSSGRQTWEEFISEVQCKY